MIILGECHHADEMSLQTVCVTDAFCRRRSGQISCELPLNDLQVQNDSIIRVGQAKWGRLESESACSVASGPGGDNFREASMHAHLTE